MRIQHALIAAALATAAPQALAAEAMLNGSVLSPLWIVPFAGILLSIAVAPVTAPAFWHHHFGKTTAFWSLAFLIPFTLNYGIDLAGREVVHTLLLEYLPFIILLFALFTISGGVHVRGNLHGSPALNTGLLGLGTLLASVMGTTGAAMLMIRPLLRANDNRRHRAHAARRSAAVPRLPQRHRFLLDDASDALAHVDCQCNPAGTFLLRRPVPFSPRRAAASRAGSDARLADTHRWQG